VPDDQIDQPGRSVRHLATERPDWLPVLQAACIWSARAERLGNGEFAGTYVLRELNRLVGHPAWTPGLRVLQAYGLIERVGSARGGRRAYYKMPYREAIEQALADIGHPVRTTETGPDGHPADN
jgi:hypothetical protein